MSVKLPEIFISFQHFTPGANTVNFEEFGVADDDHQEGDVGSEQLQDWEDFRCYYGALPSGWNVAELPKLVVHLQNCPQQQNKHQPRQNQFDGVWDKVVVYSEKQTHNIETAAQSDGS